MTALPAQQTALVDHQHPRAAPGSVDTGAIQDDAVTADKLAPALFGGTPSTIDPDDTSSNGSGTVFALSNHQHPVTAGTPAGLTKTATSAESAGTGFARDVHVHATDALPWGIVARETLTANSSGFTAPGNTDLNLDNVPVVAGRLYEITAHTRYQITGAPGDWAFECHVNGTKIGEFWYISTANNGTFPMDGTVQWVAPTTQATDDITLYANELAGTSTFTMIAAADTPRYLSIKDVGVP